MDEVLLSEYQDGKRTAHVFYNKKSKDYYALCFCCGNEGRSERFATEQLCQDWAEDWVLKAVELPELATDDHRCGCNK